MSNGLKAIQVQFDNLWRILRARIAKSPDEQIISKYSISCLNSPFDQYNILVEYICRNRIFIGEIYWKFLFDR